MVCFFLFAWLKDANIFCIAQSVEAGYLAQLTSLAIAVLPLIVASTFM